MKREKIILRYLTSGCSVLDIGSVGQAHPYRMWNFLKGNNISLTGIDTISSKEDNIVFGDMENYTFDRKFDVIIAGDVLEHVNNQGLFLENIRKHLEMDGVFILTTPNAKWPTVFLKPNPTHTLWHDRYTIEYILKQCGFDIVFFAYYFGNKPYYNTFIRPLIWRQSMFVVCKKNNKVLG